MNKFYRIFSFVCVGLVALGILLNIFSSSPLSQWLFPGLAIIGYFFVIIILWILVSIAVVIRKIIENKTLAIICIICTELALILFIKYWFFRS